MGLAVVRSLDAPRSLQSVQEQEDFEQELVDQFLLAAVGAGMGDAMVNENRSVIFEFSRFLGRPLWTAQPHDADAFLARQRTTLGRAKLTVQHKAWSLARFYDFLLLRYEGDIRRLTGHVVIQVIDEFNRPAKADYGVMRVPPSEDEVDDLFAAWRAWLPGARKYLPAARDYLAASLWRRAGLRIRETYMLDVRDWRRDLGEFGKIHVRYGKGSRGRGAKTRLVPAINQVGDLLDWWMIEVRHQFSDDYDHPDAPLLPSERRDPRDGLVLPGAGSGAARRAGPRGRAVAASLVRTIDAAYAAAFLRVVFVCPRHGPESDPGIARPRMAFYDHSLYSRPRRPYRTRVGER